MKVRFDGLDVAAMAAHLRTAAAGRRVVNVYDGGGGGDNDASYVIKLDATGARGDGDAGNNDNSSKAFILLESGIRFHPLSHFSSEGMPSPFCAKLRKALRGLRLEQVAQIGTDRVAVLTFGTGPSRHSVILELYAKGNLILCDKEFRIVALLRSHAYGGSHKNGSDDAVAAAAATGTCKDGEDPAKVADGDLIQVKVGNVYPVAYATTVQRQGHQKQRQQLGASDDGGGGGGDEIDKDAEKDAGERADHAEDNVGILSDNYQEWFDAELQAERERNAATTATSSSQNNTAKKSRKKKQKALTLKTLLLKPTSGVSQYGPALLEHCILKAGQLPHQPLLEILDQQQQQQQQQSSWHSELRKALVEEGQVVLRTLRSADGYVLYEPRSDENGGKGASASDLPHPDKVLQEFFPYLLLQHADKPVIRYDNFGAAVEEFYAQLSRQKQLLKAAASEQAARNKLERVRLDQEERVRALEREQVQLRREARVVQLNADNVDKALTVINSAISSGIYWDQLEQLVEVEQQKNNPIAMLVHKLDLEQDAMVLRLPTEEGDDDEYLDVRISLKDSAHANASALFAKYRASKEKAEKTIEASSKALKAAEDNAMRQLQEAQKKTKLAPVVKRKPAWYEKFHWFITSDNYLVLAGKDAHQNENLVKRYLRQGDAYLHADVHGAASCILRAKRRRGESGRTEPVPLPEQALREAGHFTICRSSAWKSKMVSSAWWVEADQVSKTAPTGEFLTVGSFIIRGKKTFLPPSQLEMGLAVLFRLGDDDSIARHKSDRRDFALIALENSSDFDDSIRKYAPPPKNNKGPILKGEARATSDSESPTTSEETGDPKTSEDTEQGAQDESYIEKVTDEEFVNDKQESRKKKGLSARDRRLIKKYGSLEEAERVAEQKKQEEAERVEDSSAPKPKDDFPNQEGEMKRGKKAKMKRAMKRYGDQDDEDRELAMLALQGGEKWKKLDRGTEAITDAQKEVAAETNALLVKDASELASQLPDAVRSTLAECVTVKTSSDEEGGGIRWNKFDADTLEQLALLDLEAQKAAAQRLLSLKNSTRVDNFSASLSGILRTIRKYGHENLNANENALSADKTKRKTKEEKQHEERKWKETLAEEGIVDSDNEEDGVDDTAELNKLTGKPHPDDLLIAAIPVCAPYQTLSQYSYRVKLTPGNMKRGKAAKQCVDMLVKGESPKTATNKERDIELIKKVLDNDWVQAICSDVKISAPGASKVVKKQKTNTKKKKK